MAGLRMSASVCALLVAICGTVYAAQGDNIRIPDLPEVVPLVEAAGQPAETTASIRPGAPLAAPAVEPVAAAAPSPAQDIAPPTLPPVVATMDPAAPPAVTAEILPPDLPQTAAVVEPDYTRLIAERAPLIGTAIQRLGETERKQLVAFYASRDNRPLWIADKGFNAAAQALAARLNAAPEDGLFAQDYATPPLEQGSPSAMVDAELKLSALAVLYARDARGGRLDPRRLSNLITPKLVLPASGEVLGGLSTAPDAGAALLAYNPSHPGYQALKAKLAAIRGDRTPIEPMVRIPAGPALKLGMRDARVPLIRARLKLDHSEEPLYDQNIAAAISAFQKSAGLPANGVATPSTLEALQTSPTSRLEADLITQMERWRWLPLDLGERHIMVNVPEYTVRVFDHGEVIHQARVVVGKPDTPTPIFSHVMDQVVLNPSWFVPPSILKKEFLPRLATDPDYAAKRGYVVTRGRNGSISVRQPPGERNALGHIKFLFPNEHAVYLHDTPSRALFANEKRAFSHGCVRVDQPMRLGEILLGKDEGWTEQRLKSLVGGGERTIRFTRPLPVHITYMTHVVQPDGELKTFDDIYGFHRLVRQALGLGA